MGRKKGVKTTSDKVAPEVVPLPELPETMMVEADDDAETVAMEHVMEVRTERTRTE